MVEAFESGVLDLPDFYFAGDDYRYRFEAEAKRRFLDVLRERFNVGVRYNGRVLKWDTVIEQKAVELRRYLVDRSTELDFLKPSPCLYRTDQREFRKRILSLSQSEAQGLGIRKSTLHYLRKSGRGERPFRVYRKVAVRLSRAQSPS